VRRKEKSSFVTPRVFAIVIGAAFVEEQIRLEAEDRVELVGGLVGIGR
jgi:hypothetical protein